MTGETKTLTDGENGEGGTNLCRPHSATTKMRSVTSEQLFAGSNEVEIIHGDVCYRLKKTRFGKLILNK